MTEAARGARAAAEDTLVTVVLATNRTSPYLAEALASVCAQTHSKVELLIVDDGSPDPDAVAAAAKD